MTRRFDAVLFDAGGVFILPDPVAMSTAVAPFGGDSSIPSLMRAHYAGMVRLDRFAAEDAAEAHATLERGGTRGRLVIEL